MARQVSLNTHVAWCAAYRGVGVNLDSIGASVRQAAVDQRTDVHYFSPACPTSARPSRITRRLAKDREDGRRLRVMDDMVCTTLMASLLVPVVSTLLPPAHPHSLSYFLQEGANSLGSNANPRGPATGISLPLFPPMSAPRRCRFGYCHR